TDRHAGRHRRAGKGSDRQCPDGWQAGGQAERRGGPQGRAVRDAGLTMTIEPGWLWMILAVALAAAELALPGVYLVWFAAAAAVAGLTTLIFEPSVTAQF